MALATEPHLHKGDIVASATIGGDLYVQVLNLDGDNYTGRVLKRRWPYDTGRTVMLQAAEARILNADEIIANTLEVNAGFRAHAFYPTPGERRQQATYDGDDTDPANLRIIARYFCATGNDPWPVCWVADFGDGDETGLCYGYARSTGRGHDETWRYFSLIELEHHLTITPGAPVPIVYERDPHWVPRPAHQAIPGLKLTRETGR